MSAPTVVETEVVAGTDARRPVGVWANALRVRQWLKSLLVFAAALGAGVLLEPGVLLRTSAAFVAFCALSSAGYLLNDVVDARADRLHPGKRARPVASGQLPRRAALAVAAALAGCGLVLAGVAGGPALAGVGVVYLATTASYTLGLKHVAVVELGLVASGFVLRAIAGGIAADVPLSRWFLIVVSGGAFYVVAGKRLAERRELGDNAGAHRPVLGEYTRSFLEHARTTAAAVTVTAYCLWAFERGAEATHDVWFLATTIPFVLAILRFGLALERSPGSAPEDVFLRDRALFGLILVWLALFAVAVAVG